MKKLILSLLLLLTCFGAASCSSFVGDDESIVIKSVEQEIGKNEKGEEGFYLIITYENEDKKPDKYFVPNGKQGYVGNGIKEVIPTINEDKSTTLKVVFTDKTMEPVTFDVPIGVSMTGYKTKYDDEKGQAEVYLTFSDGTESKEAIILPYGKKGDKGEDGIGFKGKPTVKVNVDGSQEVEFNFSDGSEALKITIPGPKVGNGIKEIYATNTDDPDNYVIAIRYTDYPKVEDSIIPFPRGNKWTSGDSVPNNDLGIAGDFYFDLKTKIIYTKNTTGTWEKVITLEKEVLQSFDVTFNPNYSNSTSFVIPDIREGTYLGANLPILKRDGYIFDGWYLVKNPTSSNSRFTDTTMIFDNITLYANWIVDESK